MRPQQPHIRPAHSPAVTRTSRIPRQGRPTPRSLLGWLGWFACVACWLTVAPRAVSASADLPIPEELKTPAQPAFALIGVTPASIDRPSTPKAFAVGVLSAFADSDNGLPRNLAIEVAPYWWASRPAETFESLNARTGPFQAFFQTLSLSLATSELDQTRNGVNIEGTSLGFGLRFAIIQGRLPRAAQNAKFALQAKLTQIALDMPDTGGEFAIDAATENSVRKSVRELAKFNLQRVGFQADFAAATLVDFADDKTDNADLSRTGAWLTMAYRLDEPAQARSALDLSDFTWLGTVRYLRDERWPDASDVLDAGARILWRARKFPVGISLEYVWRLREGENEDRLVGMIEYRVTEDWGLYASYGKTFGSDFDGDSALVASMGVTFGWGRGPALR